MVDVVYFSWGHTVRRKVVEGKANGWDLWNVGGHHQWH